MASLDGNAEEELQQNYGPRTRTDTRAQKPLVCSSPYSGKDRTNTMYDGAEEPNPNQCITTGSGQNSVRRTGGGGVSISNGASYSKGVGGEDEIVAWHPADPVSNPNTSENPYQEIYVTPSSSVYASSASAYNVVVDSRHDSSKPPQQPRDELVRCALGYVGGLSGPTMEEEKEWGIGKCRPEKFQQCASIKVFIFYSCLFAVISGALIAGYVSSVITTIEKRFNIGSSYSGLIAASVEVGCLVSVIIVSYFGSTRHKPIWMGCGAALQAIGALMFSLPHVIAEKYTISGGLNRTWDPMCHLKGNSHLDLYTTEMCMEKHTGNWFYILILILAQVMVGSGGSPLYTLGTTYIDDHVSRDQAPAYIAFIYATGALGPVLGFALGALMLQYYVDIFSFDSETLNLTPDDPRWVGAWWGGFLICGGLLVMVAVPFFAFPKSLTRDKERVQREKEKLENAVFNGARDSSLQRRKDSLKFGQTIKDIPKSILTLISNPIYLVASLGISCEVAIVCGFIVFLPKYLETQWTLTKPMANLLTGCIAVPGAVFGILTGGYILKRFQLAAKGAVRLILSLNLLAMLGFALLFFLGCDNIPFAGTTAPYSTHSALVVEKEMHHNLTSGCNLDCHCASNDYHPICGANGITYFSPCYAGCVEHPDTTKADSSLSEGRGSGGTDNGPGSPEHRGWKEDENYSHCTCIQGNRNFSNPSVPITMATDGVCEQVCTTLAVFMFLMFMISFVVAGTQMPLLMITIRSVRDEERAFALGLQFVILRMFAYIPAPIIFGNTIDSTCLLWRRQCGSIGSCLMYDIEKFRFRFIGISFIMKVLEAVFYVMLYLLVEKYDHPGPGDNYKVTVVHESGSGVLEVDQSHPDQPVLVFNRSETDSSMASMALFPRSETETTILPEIQETSGLMYESTM